MEIKRADKDNFSIHSLDSFDRYQSVTNVCRLVGGKLVFEKNEYEETWSDERKKEKCAEIMSGEYITFCAFDGERVIGEIMLVPELDCGRMIIKSLQVSRESRRRGIGRALFGIAADEAGKRGASELYMSACPAKETVDFYLSMGAVPSMNPIRKYVENEPCDIQMEYVL